MQKLTRAELKTKMGLEVPSHRGRKISVPRINVEEVMKRSTSGGGRGSVVSSPVPSPGGNSKTLQKAYSGKHNNCLCSPTSHAGSFRCRHHRGVGSLSVGSKLSELSSAVSSDDLPEFASSKPPPTICINPLNDQ